jgi:hypothetical protein
MPDLRHVYNEDSHLHLEMNASSIEIESHLTSEALGLTLALAFGTVPADCYLVLE